MKQSFYFPNTSKGGEEARQYRRVNTTLNNFVRSMPGQAAAQAALRGARERADFADVDVNPPK